VPSFKNIKFSKTFNIVALLAIVAAIPATMYLSQQNQDVRNRAQEENPQANGASESVPDEILLKFKPGVSQKAQDQITNEHALEVLDTIPHINVHRIKVNPNSKEHVIEALSHNPRVEFVEPNYTAQTQMVPNDPLYGAVPPQWALPKIGALAAWDITSGDGTVVAIIDSGLYMQHEDLQGQIWVNADEIPGNGIDDDTNGFIDDVNGWNFNFMVSNADLSDVVGHGTGVAGVGLAATNNSKGIASLAWKNKIMPIKVITDVGGASYFNIGQALMYAADNGAKAANISISGTAPSDSLTEAINYAWGKGLVIAAAAGNASLPSISYPAANENVLAVSSTASDETIPSSNYGPQLDLSAPGSSVRSTNAAGSYQHFSGTSLASPFVASLASLIFSANPKLTNQQVVNIMQETAVDLGDLGWDEHYGYGRINAAAAVQRAAGVTPPPDTQAPTISLGSGINSLGEADITANASDNSGTVSRVDFFVNSSLIPLSDFTAPYAMYINTPGTYSIYAKAYDAAGNVGTSTAIGVIVTNSTTVSPTFIPSPTQTVFIPTSTPTSTPSAAQLLISGIRATNIIQTAATISWITNVASTTRLEYGTSTKSLNQTTVENATLVTSHVMSVTGLRKNTNYYYRVVSKYNGVETKSGINSFKTTR
jgi:thermitase